MKKSVYSLVLMDDVVAEVDRLAYRMNTSRSNMINQILAEYVSYTTPEKRMREVFERAIAMLTDGGEFQLTMQPADTVLSLRSALAYKYNPKVSYSVELYRGENRTNGQLKVQLRSQNRSLILYMAQFFQQWSQIEQHYVGETAYRNEAGRYIRLLRLPEDISNEKLGEIIAIYIRLVDENMKLFFAQLDKPQAAMRQMELNYRNYLQAGGNPL